MNCPRSYYPLAIQDQLLATKTSHLGHASPRQARWRMVWGFIGAFFVWEAELTAAEAAAKRIGSWAEQAQARTVPCAAEQASKAEVERCYVSPPGGDQLRCGPSVDAFVRCAKL